jgi:hypothetical protein
MRGMCCNNKPIIDGVLAADHVEVKAKKTFLIIVKIHLSLAQM